jgi:hypothetical protein
MMAHHEENVMIEDSGVQVQEGEKERESPERAQIQQIPRANQVMES